MVVVNTQTDWWRALEANWDYVCDIILHHLDPFHPAYENPGDATSEPTGRDIITEIEHLKERRDARLHRYLNIAWCLASDAYAYSVPGWGDFCDLCSEAWVFSEDESEFS